MTTGTISASAATAAAGSSTADSGAAAAPAPFKPVARNPRWVRADAIDVEVQLEEGGEFHPFTATESDMYPRTADIFTRAKAGEFGAVAEIPKGSAPRAVG